MVEAVKRLECQLTKKLDRRITRFGGDCVCNLNSSRFAIEIATLFGSMSDQNDSTHVMEEVLRQTAHDTSGESLEITYEPR